MPGRPAESFTGPAIFAAVLLSAAVIATRPGLALPVLAAAETIAALACAGLVRRIRRRIPPAPLAAAVVAFFGLFWLAMAVLSLGWFSARP